MSITATEIEAAAKRADGLLSSVAWRADFLATSSISEAIEVYDLRQVLCEDLWHRVTTQICKAKGVQSVQTSIEIAIGRNYGENAFEQLLLDLAKFDLLIQENDTSCETKEIDALYNFANGFSVRSILRSSVFRFGNCFTINQRVPSPVDWINLELRSAHELIPVIAIFIQSIRDSIAYQPVECPALHSTSPGIAATEAYFTARENKMPWWEQGAKAFLDRLDDQWKSHSFQHGGPCISNIGRLREIIDYETSILLSGFCGMPRPNPLDIPGDIHIWGPVFIGPDCIADGGLASMSPCRTVN